jgi:hypothetical protein
MDCHTDRMTVIVRAAVLVVLAYALAWGLSLTSDPDAGANIGAGVLAMLAVAVGSFIWALRDSRTGETTSTLVRWILVGVIVGVAFAALPQVGTSDFFSPDLYVSDLPLSGGAGLLLVVVPAGIAILVGHLRHRSTAAPARG